MNILLKFAQAGGGGDLGSFWFSFIFYLKSSALDHLATAPLGRDPHFYHFRSGSTRPTGCRRPDCWELEESSSGSTWNRTPQSIKSVHTTLGPNIFT